MSLYSSVYRIHLETTGVCEQQTGHSGANIATPTVRMVRKEIKKLERMWNLKCADQF